MTLTGKRKAEWLTQIKIFEKNLVEVVSGLIAAFDINKYYLSVNLSVLIMLCLNIISEKNFAFESLTKAPIFSKIVPSQ